MPIFIGWLLCCFFELSGFDLAVCCAVVGTFSEVWFVFEFWHGVLVGCCLLVLLVALRPTYDGALVPVLVVVFAVGSRGCGASTKCDLNSMALAAGNGFFEAIWDCLVVSSTNSSLSGSFKRMGW